MNITFVNDCKINYFVPQLETETGKHNDLNKIKFIVALS